ncbi:hypothetical protein MUCCIDRAFT_107439 [Mucor lusitanicus CBS 277.49]|uniref:F-box domain-containing protein n=2 Tax=Mucor circinelloides f. lusitanicus TaxID=29924 RepID=A0A168NWQ1_MUCCL|nr:hypothetical protein MUCCIDRAFT_107439 [Mucor lusitanicus CBS 277.49]
MERSYQNLPPEILRLTFSYLGGADLNHAQLTCKRWSPVAQKLLYKYMRFQGSSIKDIIRMFRHHPSLAQSVNRVSLDLVKMREYYKVSDTSNEEGIIDEEGRKYIVSQHYHDMLAFLCLCPNITLIKLPPNPPKMMYHDLMELRENGYLARLGEIDKYCLERSRAKLPGYYNLLYALKNSIKDMHLNNQLDSAKEGNLTDSSSSLVLNNISSFTQLQQLRLEMQRYAHVHEFDSFLDNCSENLTTLEVVLTQDSPEFHTCLVEQIHIKHLPNIKNLTVLTSAPSSNQEIQYITRKFPGLQALSIRSQPTTAVLLADACRFFDYICRIPSVRIEGGVILTINDFTEYMPQFLQCTRFERLNFYCQHISQHTGNIDDVQIDDLYTETTSTLNTSNRPLSGITLQSACAKAPLEIIMTSQRNHIRTINITVDDRILDNALKGEDLGTILNNFSSLEDLYISGMEISHLDDVFVAAKRLNLGNFKIHCCLIDVDVFSRMSQRIESIASLSLLSSEWISDDDSSDDSKKFTLDLQMPFTKVGSLHITFSNLCSKALVRVMTNSITQYFNCVGGRRREELTYSEYKRLINESEHLKVNLCFATLSSWG